MSIKSLTVEYEPSKERSGFTRGETLTGTVVLELAKDTKIECLSVRAKGKVSVFWSENYIYTVVLYKAKEHFFSISKTLLDQSRPESKVLTAGRHKFPFDFNIPDIDLPSDWVGRHGYICYSLEARASRFMRLERKAKETFTLESRDNYSDTDIMEPQQGQDERKGIFSSGSMALTVSINKTGYQPEEGMEITVQIHNNSKDTKATPKYMLYEKQSFFCNKKRKVRTKYIAEGEGELVPAGEQVTQTHVLQIPWLAKPTLLNCNIVKQEYRLEVRLNGPMYSPVVKLPIFVLPRKKNSD